MSDPKTTKRDELLRLIQDTGAKQKEKAAQRNLADRQATEIARDLEKRAASAFHDVVAPTLFEIERATEGHETQVVVIGLDKLRDGAPASTLIGVTVAGLARVTTGRRVTAECMFTITDDGVAASWWGPNDGCLEVPPEQVTEEWVNEAIAASVRAAKK